LINFDPDVLYECFDEAEMLLLAIGQVTHLADPYRDKFPGLFVKLEFQKVLFV